MKSVIKKYLKWLAIGVALSVVQLNGQVKVNFESSGRTIGESETISIVVELSEASLLEVSVPYAIASSSTAQLDIDYEIPEDDEDNDFYNESPLVFSPGEVRKVITIVMINDDEDEVDEFIVIDLIENGLTIVELGDLSSHTIRVIGEDKFRVYFKKHSTDYSEAGNIAIPLYLTTISEETIEVEFQVKLITANDKDVDLEDTFTSTSPVEIASGITIGSINIKTENDSITDRNDGGADRETIEVILTAARFVDSERVVDFDAEPFIVTLVDNDPLTVEFSYSDDQEFPIEVDEYNSSGFLIQLIDSEGNTSTAGAEIQVPINYGGGAVRGEGDNDDYSVEDGPLIIAAGQTSASFTMVINNDDSIEEDESIEVSFGDPFYTDGGDLIRGEKDRVSFVIKDNDPVTLSFGALYSKDDKVASEDDDIDDIPFVDSSGSNAAEAWTIVSILYYLSSPSANNVEFDIEIVGDGTTATIFDTNTDASDQNWDFAVTNPFIGEVNNKVSVIMRSGSQYGLITVQLNNDTETPVIYGEDPAADVESDETVQLSISNLNSSDSKVNMGTNSSYTLTIKELPDIDITHLLNGISPDPAYLENGTPRFNQKTGLFEVHYDMQWNSILNAADFSGYQSLKAEYQISNYDASNPDAEGNDNLVSSPLFPEDGTEFHFFVDTPYQLRFPSDSKWIILNEGAEPIDDEYDITTADTIEVVTYILKPLSFPNLNDFEADLMGGFDVTDPLDWWVDFYSRGFFTMPLDRIDPATNPDRFRLYLTVQGTSVYASSSTALTIEKIVPQSDGSMLLLINTDSASSIQLQYLDVGDEWRNVQPSEISTGGASRLYWIDKGQPQTKSHPSTVNFRLYRAIQN